MTEKRIQPSPGATFIGLPVIPIGSFMLNYSCGKKKCCKRYKKPGKKRCKKCPEKN